MSTLLITGANRGIGLEFARQYAADGWEVIAGVRRPDAADTLRAIGAEIVTLDAGDPASIDDLARALSGRPIDHLIANAGMKGPRGLDAAGWAETFATNSIGPTLLAAALKANVAASSERKMVAVTSRMGSIGDNGSGGYIPYRSSKAALNAAWRSLAIDWRGEGIAVGVLHPGWVKTDMGGSGATLDPAESVAGMRRVIAGLIPAKSGQFWNWNGQDLPW